MDVLVDALAWIADSSHWWGPSGIVRRTAEHVGLSTVSVVVACAIALPLGTWLGHVGRGGVLAANVSNVGRAVPTFAVLVLLAFTPLGFGMAPTVVALVVFALPPLLTNTYVGVRQVDRQVVEAARGMGMSGWQLLRSVELPLAAPLVMSGIRLAAVQVVATATLAALVAGPGLGRIVTEGYGLQDQAQIVAGSALVTALALLTEKLLGALARRVDPMHRARAVRVDPVPAGTA